MASRRSAGTFKEAFGDESDPDCAQVNKVVRAALEAMKAAGAEVVELSLPDMQQMIGGTSLYLSRSRFDVDTFLKSRPALPYSSLKDIYATGLCHKNLDLIKLLATVAPDKCVQTHAAPCPHTVPG